MVRSLQLVEVRHYAEEEEWGCIRTLRTLSVYATDIVYMINIVYCAYNRRQLNVSVDVPATRVSAAATVTDADELSLQTVLNNLETTAFHLLGTLT